MTASVRSSRAHVHLADFRFFSQDATARFVLDSIRGQIVLDQKLIYFVVVAVSYICVFCAAWQRGVLVDLFVAHHNHRNVSMHQLTGTISSSIAQLIALTSLCVRHLFENR